MDAIVLAAGNSVRFGGNKLLCTIGNEPMYRHILKRLRRLRQNGLLEHIVVVSQYDEIFCDIEEHFSEMAVIKNPHPEEGISGSVRLGVSCLRTVSSQSDACLFTVADQPFLTEESLTGMAQAWKLNPRGILAASGRTYMGNPVIFHSQFYDDLSRLHGDAGGKTVLRANPEKTRIFQLPPGELVDLDTRDAVEFYQFSFLRERGHVISVVGAGGKTTLIYLLAEYYALCGMKVVVTTTTHIRRPEGYPLASDRESLQELFADYSVVAAGLDADEGKLRSPFRADEGFFLHEESLTNASYPLSVGDERLSMGDCLAVADVVLIEADGAKRLPCKIPAQWEPVIPSMSDIVIGVMGMDTLGRELRDVCFRKEESMNFLNVKEDHIMEADDIVRILSSEKGMRKHVENRDYYVILNKCDSQERFYQGQQIKGMLEAKGVRNVACVSLKNLIKN